MTHTHKLSTQNHFDFLNQDRKDPITGDLIKENDEIVICSSCKSAFLKESWEYLGNTHCEQNKTLAVIPKNKNLVLNYDAPNSFKIKEKEPKSSIVIAIILSILSIYTLDFLFWGYFKYICIVIAVIVTRIYLGFTLFSINEISITDSEIILLKGWNLKDHIAYKNISQITFSIKELQNKSLSSSFIITGENLPFKAFNPIFIPIQYKDFNRKKGFVKIISELSEKTDVIFRIDSSLQTHIAYENIPCKIEWIESSNHKI